MRLAEKRCRTCHSDKTPVVCSICADGKAEARAKPCNHAEEIEKLTTLNKEQSEMMEELKRQHEKELVECRKVAAEERRIGVQGVKNEMERQKQAYEVKLLESRDNSAIEKELEELKATRISEHRQWESIIDSAQSQFGKVNSKRDALQETCGQLTSELDKLRREMAELKNNGAEHTCARLTNELVELKSEMAEFKNNGAEHTSTLLSQCETLQQMNNNLSERNAELIGENNLLSEAERCYREEIKKGKMVVKDDMPADGPMQEFLIEAWSIVDQGDAFGEFDRYRLWEMFTDAAKERLFSPRSPTPFPPMPIDLESSPRSPNPFPPMPVEMESDTFSDQENWGGEKVPDPEWDEEEAQPQARPQAQSRQFRLPGLLYEDTPMENAGAEASGPEEDLTMSDAALTSASIPAWTSDPASSNTGTGAGSLGQDLTMSDSTVGPAPASTSATLNPSGPDTGANMDNILGRVTRVPKSRRSANMSFPSLPLPSPPPPPRPFHTFSFTAPLHPPRFSFGQPSLPSSRPPPFRPTRLDSIMEESPPSLDTSRPDQNRLSPPSNIPYHPGSSVAPTSSTSMMPARRLNLDEVDPYAHKINTKDEPLLFRPGQPKPSKALTMPLKNPMLSLEADAVGNMMLNWFDSLEGTEYFKVQKWGDKDMENDEYENWWESEHHGSSAEFAEFTMRLGWALEWFEKQRSRDVSLRIFQESKIEGFINLLDDYLGEKKITPDLRPILTFTNNVSIMARRGQRRR